MTDAVTLHEASKGASSGKARTSRASGKRPRVKKVKAAPKGRKRR